MERAHLARDHLFPPRYRVGHEPNGSESEAPGAREETELLGVHWLFVEKVDALAEHVLKQGNTGKGQPLTQPHEGPPPSLNNDRRWRGDG